MLDNMIHILPANAPPIVQRLTRAFAELPQVVAVVLAGSRGAATGDLESDFDIYVYTLRQVPVELRRGLMDESAEIDNRFWEPGDEWTEPSSGTQIDVMYRSPEWIEGQLDRVLVRKLPSGIQRACGITSTTPKCCLTREVGTANSRPGRVFRIPKV